MTVLTRQAALEQHAQLLARIEYQDYDGHVLRCLDATRQRRAKRHIDARWQRMVEHRQAVRDA